jgi:hypothetical protein
MSSESTANKPMDACAPYLGRTPVRGIEVVALGGFGPQNVLDDLVLKCRPPPAATPAPITVSLPSNHGLGGSFRCEQALVIAVHQFEPGPRSVYRRIDG